MKRKITLVIVILILLVAAYWVGFVRASIIERDRDFVHWRRLAELDRSFLKTVVARPNKLTTGDYVMETHFLGVPPKVDILHLEFSNGRLVPPASSPPMEQRRTGMSDTFKVDGNVVSWYYEGILYEPLAECVGVIDGDTAWGRIYGWNIGDESIGLWRLYPKTPEPKQ